MIHMGTYPPIRPVPSWDGARVLFRCDVCNCGVAASHVPGSEVCMLLVAERAAKHAVSGNE